MSQAQHDGSITRPTQSDLEAYQRLADRYEGELLGEFFDRLIQSSAADCDAANREANS